MDAVLLAVEDYLERQRMLKDKRIQTLISGVTCGTKEHVEKIYKLPAGSISSALNKEDLPMLMGSKSTAVQDYLKKHLLKGTNHGTPKQELLRPAQPTS